MVQLCFVQPLQNYSYILLAVLITSFAIMARMNDTRTVNRIFAISMAVSDEHIFHWIFDVRFVRSSNLLHVEVQITEHSAYRRS